MIFLRDPAALLQQPCRLDADGSRYGCRHGCRQIALATFGMSDRRFGGKNRRNFSTVLRELFLLPANEIEGMTTKH